MKLKILFLSVVAMVLIFLFLVVQGAAANTNYPQPHEYINDYAEVIDPATETVLNNKLGDFEKRTSNQVGVLTVKTTGDESIEEYSIHVFDQWKFGTEKEDNGAIIVFAIEDRKMRIEVGQGLEGDLTDIESKHILDDTVRPELRAGNYNAGVTNAVSGVMLAIDPSASEAAVASASATLTGNGDGLFAGIVIAVLIIIFVIVILLVVLDDASGGGGGGYGGGSLASLGGIVGSSIGGGDSGGSSGSSSGSGFSGGGGGSSSGGGASSSW